jgi:hypothetical protein
MPYVSRKIGSSLPKEERSVRAVSNDTEREKKKEQGSEKRTEGSTRKEASASEKRTSSGGREP